MRPKENGCLLIGGMKSVKPKNGLERNRFVTSEWVKIQIAIRFPKKPSRRSTKSTKRSSATSSHPVRTKNWRRLTQSSFKRLFEDEKDPKPPFVFRSFVLSVLWQIRCLGFCECLQWLRSKLNQKVRRRRHYEVSKCDANDTVSRPSDATQTTLCLRP